jgi:hypothetical protein
MVAALILLGAVCFTLVAAYQWTMFAARDWQTRIWSAVLAILLWLVWFYGTTRKSATEVSTESTSGQINQGSSLWTAREKAPDLSWRDVSEIRVI